MLKPDTRRLIQFLNETEEDHPIDDNHSDDPDDNHEPVSQPPPRGKKPTYAQDWPAYDAAKTNEDVLFKRLLQELLLLAVEEPTRPRLGRRGFDTRTKIFCMAIKEYYKSDLRKATSILKELQHLHLIGRVPCYKSLDNFYNTPELQSILDQLMLITALSLAPVERTGAIDSTGFSVSKYESWQEHKWGTPGQRTRRWVKLHAHVGCTTNVIVSAEVTEKNVADITMLPTVVGDRPRHFQFQDFVGDRAYGSREVYNFLDKAGLDVYIPFKRTSSSAAKGSRLWKEMYEFFKRCPEEYNMHYHQRSNVESTFHMLKQRFGHNLLTKGFTANQNEIKTRILCHNLCVLIQEAAERGIIADFEACVKNLRRVQN